MAHQGEYHNKAPVHGRGFVFGVRSGLKRLSHQMFLEKKTGSIEVGKYADIAIWDTDLYTAEPEAIKTMQCQMTLLEGEVVYQR